MLDFPSAPDTPAGLLLCEVFSSFGAVSTYVFFRSPWGPRRSLSIVRTGSAPLFFFPLRVVGGIVSHSLRPHLYNREFIPAYVRHCSGPAAL